jgi:hypothetical protein
MKIRQQRNAGLVLASAAGRNGASCNRKIIGCMVAMHPAH